jgi:Protein of unknown function (DUF3313)
MTKIFNKAIAGATILIAAYASVALAGDSKNSGFLKDYSLLQQAQDAAGNQVQRYSNPKLSAGGYSKIMIDPVVYYPEPQPSDKVDAETLEQIKGYLIQTLNQKVGAKAALVDGPGPGVVRMRAAITAVAAQKPGLKPYELIPIGFLVSRLKTPVLDAVVNVEVELVDSVSGELLGEVVKQGTGNQLGAAADSKLTFAEVQPVLDAWSTQAADFAASGFAVNTGSDSAAGSMGQ